MRLHRELLLVVCVCILLFNDPQMLGCMNWKAGMRRWEKSKIWIWCASRRLLRDRDGEIHLAYALNGGTGNKNPFTLTVDELPYVLNIPERSGYNFAGWYTDRACTDKITEINNRNADNMILFAKWTREIDSYYNVEMYSYQPSGAQRQKSKRTEGMFL